MKATYPILLMPDKKGFTVYVPDFDSYTQGKDITEAIEMARDLIGILGIDKEDEGQTIPAPRETSAVKAKKGEIVTLVDIDFAEYRRKNEMRTVKKNCTLPSWLCYEAEKAGLNFSALLQSAIKNELRIK